MTADLRAAAERLRRASMYASSCKSARHDQWCCDMMTLADFALGLLDSEPITERLLLEQGFATKEGHPDYVLFYGDLETRRIYTDEREDRYWSYHYGRNEVPLGGGLHPRTLGQLRSLLHALQGPTP